MTKLTTMPTQVRTFTIPKPLGETLSAFASAAGTAPLSNGRSVFIPRSVPTEPDVVPRLNGGGGSSTLPRIKPGSMASNIYDQPSASGGVTFAHQDKLPKLPIPELEKTCQKYLSVLRPLQTSREHAETRHAVDEFLRQEGPELQEKLKSYAEGRTSYIEQFCEYYLTMPFF